MATIAAALNAVGNSRAYRNFHSELQMRSALEAPLRQLLPNAEAYDPLTIPTGNVFQVSTDSNMVSELIHREPLEAILLTALPPSGDYSSAEVRGKLAGFHHSYMELAKEMPAFSLQTMDAKHWEAPLDNATIAVVRVRADSDWLPAAKARLASQQVAAVPAAVASSFLESSLKVEAPTYHYALLVHASLPQNLQEEYKTTIEAGCRTAGEVATSVFTQAVQDYLVRSANRLMLAVADHMGWDIPLQVDARSRYSQEAGFNAPLMARPDHIQINNNLRLNAEKTAVSVFNGAVDLQPLKTRRALVQLGGYDMGYAFFKVAESATHDAVAARVARKMPSRQGLMDAIGSETKNLIAHECPAHLRSGLYEKVTDQFFATCQEHCGHSAKDLSSPAIAPLILVPLITMVSE